LELIRNIEFSGGSDGGRKAEHHSFSQGTTLGGKAFPSYVAITKDGQLLVGEPARRQAVSNPEGTSTRLSAKLGTQHIYKVAGKDYTPQQLSHLFFKD